MTASSPLELSASVVLADYAETLNGKLYVQGAGWTRVVPDTAAHIAVAVLLRVPYSDTNVPYQISIDLFSADGSPYPIDNPVQVQAVIEVGRPAGMMKGEESVLPIAFRLNGIEFARGSYSLEVRATPASGGDSVLIGTASFVARS